jgi:hypothetical protein
MVVAAVGVTLLGLAALFYSGVGLGLAFLVSR